MNKMVLASALLALSFVVPLCAVANESADTDTAKIVDVVESAEGITVADAEQTSATEGSISKNEAKDATVEEVNREAEEVAEEIEENAEEEATEAEEEYDEEEYGPEAPIVWTKPIAAVSFSHKSHTIEAGLDCDACHEELFEMEAGTASENEDFIMKTIYEGGYCGACHDGDTAFAANTQCALCHIGVRGLKETKSEDEAEE